MQTKSSTGLLSLAVAAAFAAAAMSGCMTAQATGATAVFVKDAPSDDIKNLFVTFDQVQVHQKGGDSDDDESDDDETSSSSPAPSPSSTTSSSSAPSSSPTGSGSVSIDVEVEEDDSDDGNWITISEGNTTIDLKAYSGDSRAFLADADVPVGDYNGIRLRIVNATMVMNDGNESDVKVPSKSLKIKGHFTVEEGKETQLTLDFDLDRSLHQTGSGKWILKPVIHLEGEKRDRPHDGERRERERKRDDEDREFKDRDDEDDD